MQESDRPNGRDAKSPEVAELPERTLSTYARLWQLETWLRRMVYVELRADRGDGWRTDVRNFAGSFEADKELGHMPTPETTPLSYTQFSELKRLISENWGLFSPYLPPQRIWEAKLEEITQIRHRIAHFRTTHFDDYQRILQLLRDIDRGFWIFCTSYNNPQPVLPASDDPVTVKFLEYDPFPWREIGDKKWARVGHASSDMVLAVTVETLRRPWVRAAAETIEGTSGYPIRHSHDRARQKI